MMKNKDEIIPSTPSIEPKIRSKWSRIKKKVKRQIYHIGPLATIWFIS
jgi:hypothetical protein